MADKKNTDIFGNEYTIGQNGERITHHKSLWSGEDVGYSSDGKEYRTHTDIFGNQVTIDSDGVEYTTHENIFGQQETYGSDGSSYITHENIYGVTETVQTKAPGNGSYTFTAATGPVYSDPISSYPNSDPFAGLSQAQISKIFLEKHEREEKAKRDAIKKVSFANIYYWISFILCFVLAILSFLCYDRFVQALAPAEKVIPWIPLATYILSFAAGRGNVFHSIYVGIWINHVIADLSCLLIMMTGGYDRYMMRGRMWWFWIPFTVTFLISLFTLKQVVFSDPDVIFSSRLKGGWKRYLIDAFTILGMIYGWVTAVVIRLPFSGRLKAPYILVIIAFILCSIFSYYCYIKDREQISAGYRRQAEQNAEREKELRTSPKYNITIKVEDVHDEKIDGNIFAKYRVENIKNKAKLVAQNMQKPTDSEKLEILRAGRVTTAEFHFNGWIIEKYLNRQKTYKNDAMEKLMEIYCDDFYYVLEKNGELKVYNIYINLDNLDNEPYGNVDGFHIKKHDLSYVSSSYVSEAIEASSAIVLDCQVPYQKEPRTVGDELRVFNRYINNGAGRLPQYKENGAGLIDRLNKMMASSPAPVKDSSASAKISALKPRPGAAMNYSGSNAQNRPQMTELEKAYISMGFSSLPADKKALKDRYAELTKLYHPQYGETPDKATYTAVKSAYDTLMEKYFG